MALSTPESFLALCANESFAFVPFVDSARGEQELTLAEELKQIQDQFSRLKLRFIDLEALEAVLEVLTSHTITPSSSSENGAEESKDKVEVVPNETLQALEKEVRANKQDAITAKKKVRAARLAIKDKMQQLAVSYQRFERERQALAAVYNKEKSEANSFDVNAMRATNEASLAFGKAEDGVLGLADETECHTVLELQQDALKQITQSRERLLSSLSDIQQHITQAKLSVAHLEDEVAQSEKKEQHNAPLRSQQQQQYLWHTGVSAVLSKLSGLQLLSIASHPSRAITVNINTPSGPEMSMQLFFSNGTPSKLVDAKLSDSSLEISDIVAHAVSIQSLPFLIQETQGRLQVLSDM